MANLYLIDQEAVMRKKGNRIIIEKDNKELLEIECIKIETILIFGNIEFTTPALSVLLENGIELALFTLTGHKLKGQLTPPKNKNVLLRMAQYQTHLDQSFALETSKIIINGKLSNTINLLNYYRSNYPDLQIKKNIEQIERLSQQIKTTPSQESLLGIEGTAARYYFEMFPQLCRIPTNFITRERRPPTDPLNSLLSFGYTLVTNEITSLLDGIGFDPYIGYLHCIDYGRPSLALDMIEEFRAPLIDRFSLSLLNLNIITPEDFHTDEETGGLYLNQPAMKRYFIEYEKYLNREFKDEDTSENTNFRKLFFRQAQRMQNHILKNENYKPFHF